MQTNNWQDSSFKKQWFKIPETRKLDVPQLQLTLSGNTIDVKYIHFFNRFYSPAKDLAFFKWLNYVNNRGLKNLSKQ